MLDRVVAGARSLTSATLYSVTSRQAIWGAAVFATVASVAAADLKSGTIVVLAFTESKAILRADGRMVTSGHKSIDNKCKIVASHGRFLFSLAGIEGDDSWDAFSAAKRIAGTQLSGEQAATRSQMATIVSAWSSEAIAWWKRLSDISVENAFSANGTRLMTALFSVRIQDNTIVYNIVQILLDDPQSKNFRADVRELRALNGLFTIGAFGETDIADQLLLRNRKTKDVPAFIRDELRRWKSMPGNEATARFKAGRIIDLTIANSRYGYLVGGDINHVEMDGTGIHWKTDNQECRQ